MHIWIIRKPGDFLNFCTAVKSHFVSPFRYFYRPKWQISLSFHILQLVKSLPFHILEAWKKVPLLGTPSLYRSLRRLHPPPPPYTKGNSFFCNFDASNSPLTKQSLKYFHLKTAIYLMPISSSGLNLSGNVHCEFTITIPKKTINGVGMVYWN